MSAQSPTFLEQKQHCIALLKAQRAAEAKLVLQDLCRRYARDHEAWFLLGAANGLLGQDDLAESCFREAILLKPAFAEAHYNLGKALTEQRKLSEAASCYERALGLASTQGGAVPPRYADAYSNLGNVHKDMGQVGEAIDCYRRALAIRPDDAGVHSNLVFVLNYHPAWTRAQIFAEHRRWDELHARQWFPATPAHTEPDPERRLRIGYVTADFRAHPVTKFIEPLLAAHDRDRFELFCYANIVQTDAVTDRLRGYFSQWRDILNLTDDAAAARIRDDRIDILIDLIGHTANNRLLVFARKPAPLQIGYVGYPNTTGMRAMDYRFATPHTDPAGETDQYYSERLIRLDSHYCYKPWDDAPLPGKLPALAAGYVTFASFNNFAKVTPEVIALWAAVLAAVPGSRLMLQARGLGDAATQRYARETFGAHGIAADRLTLLGWSSVPEYLENMQRADIALDPFPFNGGTTTYNSLWMGMPVVSLAGESFMARTGLSVLSSLGLGELVAHSKQEYVDIAARLAGDLDRLAALRNGMRERMQSSPLIDGARYTRGYEAALRDCWREWCKNS